MIENWNRKIAGNDRILNAGVEINDYASVTFDELVHNNEKFKSNYLMLNK